MRRAAVSRLPLGRGVRSPLPICPAPSKPNLPATLAPQLATLATSVPASGEWSYEIKFDGYRLLARIDQGRARLFTRNGNDWTAKLEGLAAAVETLAMQAAWLDGEIVVLNQDGTPDFNALQNAFDASRTDSIDYFLFDLPYLAGSGSDEAAQFGFGELGGLCPAGTQFFVFTHNPGTSFTADNAGFSVLILK